MRTLAVGDIHGCYAALTTLAALVPFRPTDTLITLGDYVDRGPDSFAVLDWLMIGIFTRKPITTVPGISKKRTYFKGFASKCTRCWSQVVNVR